MCNVAHTLNYRNFVWDITMHCVRTQLLSRSGKSLETYTLKCLTVFFFHRVVAAFSLCTHFSRFSSAFFREYSILSFTYGLKCIFDTANWCEICYGSKRDDDWRAGVSVCYIYYIRIGFGTCLPVAPSLRSFLLHKFILFHWIFILAQIVHGSVVDFAELNHIKV